MDEATLFKFGKWIKYDRIQSRGKKISLKGAWSGSRDPFKNFKPPSIFLEWMKLHCLSLASGLTTASPTLGVKNPRKWHGLGHMTLFKNVNLFNISGMDEATHNFIHQSGSTT